MPYTDQMGTFQKLDARQRVAPPATLPLGGRGSALYDAIAYTLCRMRVATNAQQALVVLTDGMDEHSRLQLEQLLSLVRSSRPQVFIIGMYSKPEYKLYQDEHKTVTIVGLREIDNPLLVFKRLARESGAEAFFPAHQFIES
jgi:hypothetical protein